MRQSFSQTLSLIKSDMQKRCDYEHKKLSLLRALRFCLYSASACLVVYRLQVFFYQHHMRPIARLLYLINAILLGAVRIDSNAKIGPRLMLLHAHSITIDAGVVVGSDCVLAHQNTISANRFFNVDIASNAAPVIGDHLFMGAGSVIMGPIILGNHVQVAANSFADQSYPDNATLFGIPARNVSKTAAQKIGDSTE